MLLLEPCFSFIAKAWQIHKFGNWEVGVSVEFACKFWTISKHFQVFRLVLKVKRIKLFCHHYFKHFFFMSFCNFCNYCIQFNSNTFHGQNVLPGNSELYIFVAFSSPWKIRKSKKVVQSYCQNVGPTIAGNKLGKSTHLSSYT